MTFLKSLGIMLAALVVQSTIVHWSVFKQIHPDLMIVMLVFISMRYGPIVGVFCGFATGLVQDIYAVEVLGVNALCKSLVGYLTGLFDETHFTFSPSTKLGFLILAFFMHDIIYNMLIGLPWNAFFDSLLKESLPTGIFTFIFGIFVFFYFNPSSRE